MHKKKSETVVANRVYSQKRLGRTEPAQLDNNEKRVYDQQLRRNFNNQLSMLRNTTTTMRSTALQQYLNPRIDMNFECRYPDTILMSDYTGMYARNGLAARVVNIFPEESWNLYPVIQETEDENETAFEKEWKELEKEKHVLSYLQRIDVLSGIGEFGVLLLGISDGKELNEPVEGIDDFGKKVGTAKNELLFLKPLSEQVVKVSRKNADVHSPRYGMPEIYSIEFEQEATDSKNTLSVHWTRLIHVADNRETSEINGVPRMQTVYNYLLDLRKILGGSGEMFWKGGFPGLSFETQPEPGQGEIDKEGLKDQMEDYYNGQSRYLATEGIKVNSLQPQVSSPKEHMEVNVKAIAMSKGIPYRIFLGTEEAKLASTQDTKAWNKRVDGRNSKYVTPFIIRPLIDRFMAFGILTEVEYIVTWPDLNAPSKEDIAIIAEKRASAMAKYLSSGVDSLMAPFEFMTMELGYSDEEAKAIEKGALDWTGLDDPEPEDEFETFEDVDGGKSTKTKGKRPVGEPIDPKKKTAKKKVKKTVKKKAKR